MTYIYFSDALSLASQTVSTVNKVEVIPSVHHIIVIDVSGSMWNDLPSLRTHLKNKLSTLVGEKDTVSILWFSGKGQFGILQEAVPVRSLSDLSTLHKAIDKWLQPVGLTGFKEPIQETINLINRLKKNDPSFLINFFFMSDGYDNQWSKTEILKVTQELGAHVDNSVFVEYGWNCDRNLLSKMAESAGGSLVFSEHFENYQTVFDHELSKDIRGGKKILVKLAEKPSLGYAFAYDTTGNLVSYTVNENGEVLVPESIGEVHYFATLNGGENNTTIDTQVYFGLATLSQRMLANEIFTVLGDMGDVYLVNRFVNSFSKQDYTDFQNECISQGLDASSRFKKGINRNAVPKEDAFTILDLLQLLSDDDNNLIYPQHESFGYKRIGAGSKQRDDSVKFEISDKSKGYPISGIVFNEDRPNVSFRVKYDGVVTLPEKRSEFNLPEKINSYIYRNYTIIRDGIVNIRKLPVSLTQRAIDVLREENIIDFDVSEGDIFVLDMSKIPVINRNMVKSVSAKDTFTKVFNLEQLKATQKVLKYYRDQYAPKKSEGFSVVYGEDATAWLKEIGVTDYNGFNPPSDSVPMTDVYTATEMKISIKGLSSLPSVNDVLKKMDAGKSLTLRESLLEPAIKEVKNFMDSPLCKNSTTKDELIKTWLKSETNNVIAQVRDAINKISRTKFAIILGHVWFNDLAVGETTMNLSVGGKDITVTADVVEKEIGATN